MFYVVSLRHLNLVDKNLGRIKKKDIEIAKGLHHSSVDFSVSKKDYSKIEGLNGICHIAGKYRGCAHWNCIINLKITKMLPIPFDNLKSYDSHLIFKELSKFNCRVTVRPNGLENGMSLTLNNNFVFIDIILFMKSSLGKLVQNLGSENFKYLSEVLSHEKLELVKKKGIYPYEYFNSFKKN